MGEKSKDARRFEELDDLFDSVSPPMMPQRPRTSAPRDTEPVEITVCRGDHAAPGPTLIPPPDPDRLARARSVLASAERKSALRPFSERPRAHSFEPISLSEFSDEREAEYLRAQRKRDELEARYRFGKEEPIPPPAPAPDRLFVSEHSPSDNPLLHRVSVYRTSPPEAFDRIRQQALAIHRTAAPEQAAEQVPFSAALPRYEDMSPAQLACYLRWREKVREGVYLPIDGAYVYLYAYEILNLLPDPTSPDQALGILCELWQAFHKAEPRLDYLIPEWICDLCLVYRLSPTREKIAPLLETALRVASLKEFYFGFLGDGEASPFAHAVYRYASNYRWQESKFLTPGTEHLFKTHIPAAFLSAFTKLEQAEADSTSFGICNKQTLRAQMIRQSFAGSCFARSVKHRVEVTYTSCSRSIELRFMATDLMKYCENQIRRLLGVKSRYHTTHLEPRLKLAVDEYFSPLLSSQPPKKRPAPTPEPPPAWEALYEAPARPFSQSAARKIEQDAWEITKKLVETFSEEETEKPSISSPFPPKAEPAAPLSSPDRTESSRAEEKPVGKKGEEALLRAAFALLLDEKNTEFFALAQTSKMLPPTLAERMNECALDLLGDIAVEEENGCFHVIEDYKEDLIQWLNL